jgi:acyl dehydratase
MAEYRDEPLSFHQIEVGDRWISASRTVTEADVVLFAGLTADYNPLHVDHEFARSTPFRKPIAHGLLGVSWVAGLGSHSPWMRTVAFLKIREWNFLKPIYVGDTLHVHTEVVAKELQGRGRRGLVIWKRQLINQSGAVVQEGVTETIVQASGETQEPPDTP